MSSEGKGGRRRRGRGRSGGPPPGQQGQGQRQPGGQGAPQQGGHRGRGQGGRPPGGGGGGRGQGGGGRPPQGGNTQQSGEQRPEGLPSKLWGQQGSFRGGGGGRRRGGGGGGGRRGQRGGGPQQPVSRYGDLPPPPVGADGRPYDVEDELADEDGPPPSDDEDERAGPPGASAATPGGEGGGGAGGRGARDGGGERRRPRRRDRARRHDDDDEAAADRAPRREADRPAPARAPVHRVKQRPSDFRVVEVVDLSGLSTQRGAESRALGFGWHTLRKKKITTQEAIARIARLHDLPRSDFAYGGLKDKQSWSQQVVSLRGGILRYSDPQVKLAPLGRHAEPMASRFVRANRFTLTVRGLERAQADKAPQHLAEVEAYGLPNYFDSQRFGSIRFGQGLLGRELCHGQPERALQLFLATPSERDRSSDHHLKRIIAERWGDWEGLARRMHASPYGIILGHLAAHPDDFWGAIGCMHRPLRALHLFAYQSYLWNRTLALYLEEVVSPGSLFTERYAGGRHLFYRTLAPALRDELRELEVPLLAPDMDAPDPKLRAAITRALAEEGIDLEDLRLPEESGAFFKTEMRRAVLFPAKLVLEPPVPDALNDGRLAVTLSFELPRGAYATLLMKRIFPSAR